MCDCIDEMNALLAEENAVLDIGIVRDRITGHLMRSPPVIRIAKLDRLKRGALPALLASYCPFCGEKYPFSAEDYSDG